MEADWAVAMGADDPIVVVPWAASAEEGNCRFIDLRGNPHLVDSIAETRASAPLRDALLLLNSPGSPVWTAKCDLWRTDDESRDPWEMDAEPRDTAFCSGSYIDLLARDRAFGSSFERQEEWLRRVTQRLRGAGGKASRVELVLRHAEVEGRSGFAVSWFVEGCGATAALAEDRWSHAMALSLAVILDSLSGSDGEQGAVKRYNERRGE
jgi:hypothetical protein